MPSTLRRITVIAVALTVIGLLLPIRADAQPYEGASLTCSPTTVSIGDDVTCTATGCNTGEVVDFFFNGEPWASGVAQSPVTVTAPVPPGTPPGPVEVTATCGGGAVLSTMLQVVASVSQAAPVQPVSAPASTASLPVTGSDSISWAQIAVVLIAVGGLLVLATRKRSRSEATAGS